MIVGSSKMAIFAYFARYIFRTFTSKATIIILQCMLCEGVIIRLRCSSFPDDIYIYRLHRGPCKNTKKSCGTFISERIGVIFGTPVGDNNARNLSSIFFQNDPLTNFMHVFSGYFAKFS